MDEKPPNIDYMQILKEQFSALQAEHQDLRRRYELEHASSSSATSSSFPARLLSLSQQLLEKERFSDVHFVHPSTDAPIPAHKIILSARTDVWKELEQDSVIHLSENIDLEGFRRVLWWMYRDEFDWEIEDVNLLKMCETAGALKLDGLQKLCMDQLSARLSVDNCIQIYQFAEKNSFKPLSTASGTMIATCWSSLDFSHFASMAAPLLYRLISENTPHVLHSIVSTGREDVLFLYFMQNSAKLSTLLNRVDDDGATALEVAFSEDVVRANAIGQQLVEKGMDLETRDGRGETILMRMCRKENLAAMNFLISKSVDARACQQPDDYNVCHVASRIPSEQLANWLMEHKDKLDVNKTDSEERTPLMRAVIHNNLTIARALINCGASLDTSTSDGQTALSTCALISNSPNRQILELLLNNGADANFKIHEKSTPFINEVVERNDILTVEALLRNKALNIEMADGEGRTALHVAALNGYSELVAKIIDSRRGTLQWSRDGKDQTPLDIVVERKDFKSAKIIIKGGADVNDRDSSELTLLAKAILADDDEMGVFLIENDAKAKDSDHIEGKSYLEAACERGLLSTVRAFVSNGCKLNARCSTGFSIVHAALQNSHHAVAALLVSRGCDLESWVTLNSSRDVIPEDSAQWHSKQTLLHKLIDDGDQEGAVFLIEHGADINARQVYSDPADDDGFSPAHMAISWAQNEVLKALRDKGADLTAIDADGRTPCHIGVREQNTDGVKVLLEAESVEFIPIRDKFGQTVLSQSMQMKDHKIAALIVSRQPHAAVQTNGNGENLLHQAIRQNDLESVLFLMAVAKADPTRPITDGSLKTPLHLAAVAKNEMILRNLILLNDDVNVKSADGCTPLLDAIKARNDKHAGILIENGAEPNVQDEYGENALLCAVRSGSMECIRTVAEYSRTHRHSRNRIGYTSLHICALLTIDKLPKRVTSTDIVELVLSYEEVGGALNEKQFASFVDARDNDGNTALMIAYSQGNAGVCRSLLRRRACMGQRNNGDVNIFNYEMATKQLLLGLLESLEAEPRWSDGDTCDCGSKFSLTSRKHHCRHCGRHVCSKCSETQMPIAKYGEEKRVRVCDVCAHVISTGTAPRR